MRLSSAVVPILLLTALPHITRGQGATSAEADVRAVVDRLFDGMRAADSTMVRSAFATGARFANVNDRTAPATIGYEPPDGWLAGVAKSAKRWDERIHDVEIRVDGNMAQVWAPYTFYLDGKIRHCGVDSMELQRDATGWKITQLADTQRREGCREVGVTGMARPDTAGPHPFFEFQVDEQVIPLPGSPMPVYPSDLKASNVEGMVLAQFVVGTDGRAKPATLKVLRSDHALFTEAVRTALPKMRFSVAKVGGRKVEQLVQQPFNFSPNR